MLPAQATTAGTTGRPADTLTVAPWPAKVGRLEVVDFLRGIAILEMTVTHFSDLLPAVLAKVVGYTETAMALFVLLAGFMVGWHYGQAYQRDPVTTRRRLWWRAGQILLVQYLVIATLSVPLHLIGYGDVGLDEPLWLFVLKSVTLLNQIGLIHILPTFIPLFLVAPLVLALLPCHRWLLIGLSAAWFAIGNVRPYLIDLGDPTIFPFIVVQVYFVAGAIWGHASRRRQALLPLRPAPWLGAALVGLVVTMSLLHGKIVPAQYVTTHPLNLPGLLYHLPLVAVVVFGGFVCWPLIAGWTAARWCSLLGRHALLAFVLHVYAAKLIGVALWSTGLPSIAGLLLAVSSVTLTLGILRRYERHVGPARPGWVRVIDALFK